MKIIILIVSLFISSNVFAQYLSFSIRFTDGISSDTLYFGVDPTATEGIDPHLGEQELPPMPPSGVFDVRFIGTDLTPPVPIGQGLERDYRRADTNATKVKYHEVKFQSGTTSPLRMNWWNLPVDVSVRLQDLTTFLVDTTFTGTGNYTFRFAIPHFFTVTYSNYVSPVELTSFYSIVRDNDINLHWTTSSEINNTGFEIQRQNVGSENWSLMGFVESLPNVTHDNYEYTDRNLQTGNYKYRLKQIDLNGNFEYFYLTNNVEVGLPGKISLSQNYPNPFNPITTIKFSTTFSDNVKIKIYDISSKLIQTVLDEYKPAGYYEISLDAQNLSSGIYYYSLETMDHKITKSMIILK